MFHKVYTQSILINFRFAEILAGIEEEVRVTEGLTWKELLLPINRWRVFIVITLQIGMSTELNVGLMLILQVYN